MWILISLLIIIMIENILIVIHVTALDYLLQEHLLKHYAKEQSKIGVD